MSPASSLSFSGIIPVPLSALCCLTCGRTRAGHHHDTNTALAPAGLRPASQEDQTFWAELPQAKEDGQDCLQLPGNSTFLDMERFMIRACYRELAARLETYYGKL